MSPYPERSKLSGIAAGLVLLAGLLFLYSPLPDRWFGPVMWAMWEIHREWEPGSAPPDEQRVSEIDQDYYDRMSCEAVAQGVAQGRQRSISHLTEPGGSLTEDGLIYRIGGRTFSTRFICLQAGQRPEGM